MKNLRIADIQAEIRAVNLPNTSLQCYRYGNMLVEERNEWKYQTRRK
jgi:hypothetical protein